VPHLFLAIVAHVQAKQGFCRSRRPSKTIPLLLRITQSPIQTMEHICSLRLLAFYLYVVLCRSCKEEGPHAPSVLGHCCTCTSEAGILSFTTTFQNNPFAIEDNPKPNSKNGAHMQFEAAGILSLCDPVQMLQGGRSTCPICCQPLLHRRSKEFRLDKSLITVIMFKEHARWTRTHLRNAGMYRPQSQVQPPVKPFGSIMVEAFCTKEVTHAPWPLEIYQI
jgi:hypothetical protein